MMVQDAEGRWWAKHRETGEWHYYDGNAWVRGTPPGQLATTAVPDVSGRSLEEAEQVLSNAGLTLGDSRTQKSRQRAGTVISTDPSTGSEVDVGTSVTPIVSSGRRISPWIIGSGLLAALALLAVLALIGLVLVAGPENDTADSDVIFQDDFSSASSGWPRKDGPEFLTNYANGGYRIYNPPPVPSTAHSLVSAAGSAKDARVEVEAAVYTATHDSNSWGIICRARDDNNFYMMGIHNDGLSYVGRVKNNQYSVLADGDPSDAIRKTAATHHIRGDCVGSKLTLYVNGQKLVEANDTEFDSGQVGLFASYNTGLAVDVLFDNFSVSNP
jgi:hypothetical protein